MDGNNEAQIKNLRDKGKLFANHIRTSSLSHDESWHAFKTTILKTLEYPMEAINLTKKEWNYIMAPVLQATLPKSGIVRTFPHTVLYASQKFSGLGIIHPFYHQHLKHIHTCLEQTTTQSITRNLIHTNTEQLRLELGFNTNGNWFTSNTKSYLTPSWIRDLFTFCDSHSIQLLDNCAALSLQTNNDRFLMQILQCHYFFMQILQCHYSSSDLRMLNQCKEYLQVLTVSDITTADGRYLDDSVLSGQSML